MSIKILLLGRAQSGKRYFMNKVGANVDMHLNIPLTYYQQNVLMERPQREFELRKYTEPKHADMFAWTCLVVVAFDTDTIQQLHTARNLLMSAHSRNPKAPVIVVFHKHKHKEKKACALSFNKRKNILELDKLPLVTVLDLDYKLVDDENSWTIRIHKALTWATKHIYN